MTNTVMVNTRTLKVWDTFYFAGYSNTLHRVTAQGPEMFGYAEAGYESDELRNGITPHADVWIANPRDKVGEFKVGEKITGLTPGSEIYRITAVGEEYSLVRRIDKDKEHSVEFSVHHSHFVNAVKP